MGYSVARMAVKRGHSVVLISGPVALKSPPGVLFIPVVSAEEMCKETLKWIKRSDALVMTAAVSDFRPAHRLRNKMKKENKETFSIQLVRTPDILSEVARVRPAQLTVVGFALEDSIDNISNAKGKLRLKRLDMVVLDSVKAIGAKDAAFVLITSDSRIRRIKASKYRLAAEIINFIEKRWKEPSV
jgi:phosphopantothenoylcysteine decarboxylase/phosphopantothenate--cysteine ligase